MDKSIIVDHLSYTDQLNDVSFTIQNGELVGILGDSKKSSILKAISGITKPDSGFVSILGYDPYKKSTEFLRKISYLSEQENLYLEDIQPIDLIEITKVMYNMTDREFNKSISELTKFISDPNLINSLIYKPEILLLDHTNLDLESVYNYNKKYESTILVNADKIDSLVNIVRRVILVDKGSVLYDGAIDEILEKFAKEKIIKAKLLTDIDIKSVEQIGTVKKYTHPYIYISAPRSVVSFASAELLQNFPVVSLSIEELSVLEIIENIKNDI